MPRLGILIFGLLIAAPVFAAILDVPDQYQTIQEGINSANRGDTVLVAPGVYQENLDFLSKSITVASRVILTGDQGWIDSTIIDGHQNGPCALIENLDHDEAILRGFSLTNGLNRLGGGVSTANATASVIDCHIYHNTALVNGGGGGVFLRGGNVGVSGCDVSFNDTDIIDGGGFFIDACNPVIANTTVAFNCVDARGGGMFFTGQSLVTLRNVILWGNAPQQAWVFRENRLTILYTLIEGGQDDMVVDNPESYLRWQDCNIFENPRFVDFRAGNLNLAWPTFPEEGAGKSPCIDTGDPGARLDPDGTRSDFGGYPFFQTAFILASPETLHFNPTRVNESDWQWVTLHNGGGGIVQFSAATILPQGTPFSVNNPEPFQLTPGGEHELWLRFAPRSPNSYEGVLHLETDLEDRPVVEVFLTGATQGIDDPSAAAPTLFGINSLYPNPFNSELRLDVGLPLPANVKLLLIDNAGRTTRELHSGWLPAGLTPFICDGRELAAGMYWLRLEDGERSAVRRLAVVR